MTNKNEAMIKSYISRTAFINNRAKYDRREQSEIILGNIQANDESYSFDGRVIVDIAPSESEVISFQSQMIINSNSVNITSIYKNDSFRGKTRPNFMGGGEYQEKTDGNQFEEEDSFILIKKGTKKYVLHTINGISTELYKIPFMYMLELGILPEFEVVEFDANINDIDKSNVQEIFNGRKK